jgi:hypothetical protein
MGARARLELREQVPHVAFHGLFREEEPLADLAIDQALGDQLEHFDLTRGRFLLELAEWSGERNDLCVALSTLRGHLVEATGMAHVSGQDLSALRSIHDAPRIGGQTRLL